MRLRGARWFIALAAGGNAWALRYLRPRPADLIDRQWHREAPVRLVTLGTSGPDQPMKWYDVFRYEPAMCSAGYSRTDERGLRPEPT